MAETKKTTGGERLPVVTVARFKAAMQLMERIVDQNTDLFIGKQRAYRERAREGTTRKLSAADAASVAAGLAAATDEDPVDLAVRVQESDLRASDDPQPMEVLLAAGLSTAPALLEATQRLVALLELPQDVFEEAYDTNTVDEAIEKPARELERLDLTEGRERANAAFHHLAREANAPSGEVLRLLAQAVWQAFNQAAEKMALDMSSGLSSLTGSLEPTDGASETSSTASLSAAP